MSAAEVLDRNIAARYQALTSLMSEKEGHQLGYVFKKDPKPYYDEWKAEANAIFTLLINLKHRRRKKAG